MARPKRIDLPFSLYHVLSRTVSGELAFRDAADFARFLSYLARYLKQFSFHLHAYCLMDTHFHILVESEARGGLSEFMRRLLTAYTVYYNRRHMRHGPLFQGRFKSYLVDKSEYLLAVSRYIHLNPAKKSSPAAHERHPWSSMRHYLNGGEPDFLHTAEILSWFKGDRPAYAAFVHEGLSEGMKPGVMQQRYIAGEPFAKRVRLRLEQIATDGSRAAAAMAKKNVESARREEQAAGRLLSLVAGHFKMNRSALIGGARMHGRTGQARTVLIALLHERLTWTYDQIARYVGLPHISAIAYHLKKAGEDEALKETLATLSGEPDREI